MGCGVIATVKIALVGSVDTVTGIVFAGSAADDTAVVGEGAEVEGVDRAFFLKDIEDGVDAFVDKAVGADLDAAGGGF